MATAFWTSLTKSWQSTSADMERVAWQCWAAWRALPEFDAKQVLGHQLVDLEFSQLLIARFEYGSEQFVGSYKELVHGAYFVRKDLRAGLRSSIGVLLSKLASSNPRKAHVAPLLNVLEDVISGLQSEATSRPASRSGVRTSTGPLAGSCRALLDKVLLPLHTPNEMIDWRDQVPVLQRYHEALVRCLVRLAEKEEQMVADGLSVLAPGGVLVHSLEHLLRTWPTGYGANTPKEVLLLHEVETLLVRIKLPQHFSLLVDKLLARFDECLRHDNARPMQRALTMFKNDAVLDLFKPHLEKVLGVLLPALFRGGQLNWNPTVNRMTALALQSLEALDASAFEAAANRLFGSTEFQVDAESTGNSNGGPSSLAITGGLSVESGPVANVGPDTGPQSAVLGAVSEDGDDKAAVDGKRARDGNVPRDAIGAPVNSFPLPKRGTRDRPCDRVPGAGSVVGLGPSSSSSSSTTPRMTRWSPGAGAGPPPLTVTGVAPWAFSSSSTGGGGAGKFQVATAMPGPAASSISSSMGSGLANTANARVAVLSRESPKPTKNTCKTVSLSGLAALRAFTARCLPAPKSREQQELEAANHWTSIQALPSPTLLPDLRFHDLVFGRDLGSGSFATVRYARHILKGKTRSDWPEYAVKVISISNYASTSASASASGSTSKTTHKDHGRADGLHVDRQAALAAALREIAILQMLAHPGIARLISAFRYTGALYLVLEYGAGGDLHSHVMEHGPLTHPEIKFVAGEVLSALLSLAALDLCFNDLKPENVVLTEPGHLKLVDFGACRPLSARGLDLLKKSAAAASDGGDGDGDGDSNAAVAVTVLRNMRDGDWRDGPRRSEDAASMSDLVSVEEERAAWECLLRGGDDSVEGTPAYLPPEMLTRLPLEASQRAGTDPWALGCLLHFLRAGRPKYFGTREQVMAQHKRDFAEASGGVGVRFEAVEQVTAAEAAGSESGDRDDAEIAELTGMLLRNDPKYRLTLTGAAAHPYFVLEDPLRLHWGPATLLAKRGQGRGGGGGRLKGGAADSGGEGGWAQRQLSKVWCPLPPSYDLSAGKTQTRPFDADEACSASSKGLAGCWEGAIDESDVELGSSFLPQTFVPPSVGVGVRVGAGVGMSPLVEVSSSSRGVDGTLGSADSSRLFS